VEKQDFATKISPLITTKLEFHSQTDSEVKAFSPNSSSSPVNQKNGINEPNPQDDMQSQKVVDSSLS
jgi:hypothetical protein